ncbi:PadR family transcriptional regulator [Candidatus Bathyarchaeota archaeon]|nr:PadR family transcriptional regulator [Candidatus Bathyarchaeota archaeon]
MMAGSGAEGVEELLSDFSRFYILLILFEGPAHGYSIMSRFKKRTGREVSPSPVYPFLQKLEERGWPGIQLNPWVRRRGRSSSSQRREENYAMGCSSASQGSSPPR